jgi:cation diffusion facilitator CzcD-associated flavoprotein CzcO
LQYSPHHDHSFPPTWPVYTPALKLANWLESYASSLDLNVWTSSNVSNAAPDASGSKWTVAIKRPHGERVFKEVRHVVFATGLGSGDEGAKLPVYLGMVSVMLSPSIFRFRVGLININNSGDIQGRNNSFEPAQTSFGS